MLLLIVTVAVLWVAGKAVGRLGLPSLVGEIVVGVVSLACWRAASGLLAGPHNYPARLHTRAAHAIARTDDARSAAHSAPRSAASRH